MKAILFFLLALGIANLSKAQEAQINSVPTKQVTTATYAYAEKYNVLQDNQQVKHGLYLAKSTSWQTTGQYNMGKPVGSWVYYGGNGKLEKQYDFDSNTFIQINKSSALTKKLQVLTGGKFVEGKVDQEPFFITGDAGMFSLIGINLKYPMMAIRDKVSGTVFISAEITETGEMINEKIAGRLHLDLDQEALRVVQLLPDEWVPARVDGQVVRTKIFIPVKFTLMNNTGSQLSR